MKGMEEKEQEECISGIISKYIFLYDSDFQNNDIVSHTQNTNKCLKSTRPWRKPKMEYKQPQMSLTILDMNNITLFKGTKEKRTNLSDFR